MNATIAGHGERVGRAALRLAAAGILALLVLGAAIGAAGAAEPTVTISQSEFIELCRKTGGTPSPEAAFVVKCSYPGGYTVLCNFWIMQCADIFALTPDRPSDAPAATDRGAVLDGGAADAGGAPLHAGAVAAPTGGGVLLADDDDRR